MRINNLIISVCTGSVIVITCIFCIGREEEAEAVLREAITVMPADPHFYFSLGVLLAKMKQLEVYVAHNTQQCSNS